MNFSVIFALAKNPKIGHVSRTGRKRSRLGYGAFLGGMTTKLTTRLSWNAAKRMANRSRVNFAWKSIAMRVKGFGHCYENDLIMILIMSMSMSMIVTFCNTALCVRMCPRLRWTK